MPANSVPTMGAQSVSRFTAAGHGDADRAGAGGRGPEQAASAGCPAPGCAGKTWETFEHDRVRPGSAAELGELSDGSFVPRRQRVAFGLSGRQAHALCSLGPPAGGSSLGALRPGTGWCRPARQGDMALPPTKARQLRLPAGTTWGTWKGPKSPGALHTHRRTLRTPVPGHHVQPGLLPVGSANPMATAAAIDRVVHHSSHGQNSTCPASHRSGPAARIPGVNRRIIDGTGKSLTLNPPASGATPPRAVISRRQWQCPR